MMRPISATCVLASLSLAACSAGEPALCDDPGHACRWLGMSGELGFNGDGHGRLDTMVHWTMATLFARDGVGWFVDWNDHLVRKVTVDDRVQTVVGWTDPIFPGDGDPDDPIAEQSAAGAPGTEVQLNHPTDLVELADGRILLVAWHNHKLRIIDPATGRVSILAGGAAGFAGDGGPVSGALFKQPSRVVMDEQQNLYILDQGNLRVREVDAQTRTITTVAGNGTAGFAGDGGPSRDAMLSFAIGSNPEPSGGIAYHAGTLFIADTDNNRIRSVEDGIITTFAGTGEPGFRGEGEDVSVAMFDHPRDLQISPDGTELYVADTDNGRVRAINLATRIIRTVVGTATQGLGGDEGLATETQLDRPFGIDFDRDGYLYVSDSLNSRILRVAP